jgi:hypothetical protein
MCRSASCVDVETPSTGRVLHDENRVRSSHGKGSRGVRSTHDIGTGKNIK